MKNLIDRKIDNLIRHYRGADGALILFDFSQPNSFESIINWCNEVKENTPPECILCLVGNKVNE